MQQQGGRDAGQRRLYWVNEMEDKNDNTNVASLRGIFGGPVMLAAALLVFLVAAQVSGQNGWMDETILLALPVVAALGSVVENIGRDRPVDCPLEHLADRRGVCFGRRGLRLGLLPEGGRVEGGRLRAHVPGQG